MYALRSLAAFATAAAALTLAAGQARADGTGDAWTDGRQIGARAESGGTGDAVAGGSGASTCYWEKLGPEGVRIVEEMTRDGIGKARGTQPGTWYRKVCDDANGWPATTIEWVTKP